MPKQRETHVEKRLKEGALILATNTGDPTQPVSWTYLDDGRSARADVCARLLASGVMAARDDGLFPGTSQTYALSR